VLLRTAAATVARSFATAGMIAAFFSVLRPSSVAVSVSCVRSVAGGPATVDVMTASVVVLRRSPAARSPSLAIPRLGFGFFNE
jgi:hypothetical protein